MFSLDDDLGLGHRLADMAGGIAMSYFRREFQQWANDGSLATEADLAVEDAIRARIAAERPGDAILGEERGQTGTGSRRWIIDGIDGTHDFALGGKDWGTLIALEVGGRIVVGLCDEAAHGRRYWARRGGGAFYWHDAQKTPERLRVSAACELRAARSYLPPARRQPNERARVIARRLAGATKPEPHTDHPALQVAFGGYEVATIFTAGPWDLAAPAIIVEEAGGRFTDLEGRHNLTSGTAVFSNGKVHGQVMAIISAA